MFGVAVANNEISSHRQAQTVVCYADTKSFVTANIMYRRVYRGEAQDKESIKARFNCFWPQGMYTNNLEVWLRLYPVRSWEESAMIFGETGIDISFGRPGSCS